MEQDYDHDGDGTAEIEVQVTEVDFRNSLITIKINGETHELEFQQKTKITVEDCHVKASGTITVEPDQQ